MDEIHLPGIHQATGTFEGMTEDERHATFDEYLSTTTICANGHLVAEVALQPPETALTLYWKNLI